MRLWQIKMFRGFVHSITNEATGIVSEELFKAYLGPEWSFVRQERFIKAGEVDIQPIRHYLNRETIIRKLEAALRNIHSDFLVNTLFFNYKETDKWIISDMFYYNELNEILNRGGLLIRVNRPGQVGVVNPHISETALDDFKGFHEVIENDGDLQELNEKVRLIVRKYNLV